MINKLAPGIIAACCGALLAACASEPLGPTVQVLPAPNKPFQAFQDDDVLCRHYASDQVAGQASAANEKAVGGAVLATALGAGLGAAIGGGQGAGIGAAGGSLVGAANASDSSQYAQSPIQRQYNNAYVQCMYSKGNQVPGYAPAPAYPPPPPQGYPPPPPPPQYQYPQQ